MSGSDMGVYSLHQPHSSVLHLGCLIWSDIAAFNRHRAPSLFGDLHRIRKCLKIEIQRSVEKSTQDTDRTSSWVESLVSPARCRLLLISISFENISAFGAEVLDCAVSASADAVDTTDSSSV